MLKNQRILLSLVLKKSLIISVITFQGCQTSKKPLATRIAEPIPVAWFHGVKSRQLASDVVDDSEMTDQQKDQFKKHFKNLNSEQRNAIIAKAEIFKKKPSVDEISQVDVIENLKRKCSDRPDFNYGVRQESSGVSVGEGMAYEFAGKSNSKTYYEWPSVTCQYKPDHELTGQSSKFKCDVQLKGEKTKTVKVKYASDEKNPTDSEVIETIIATEASHLMGFATETYCPVRVTCEGCPSSNPWQNARSSAPAVSQGSAQFEYALIEVKQKGYEVALAGVESDKPQGLAWEELRFANPKDPAVKEKLIDREVWMLWASFLRYADADPHNQKIICDKAKVDVQGNPVCEHSVVYTHDYGKSIAHMYFNLWAVDVLERKDGKCIGTLDRPKILGVAVGGQVGTGIIVRPSISEEARQIFLARIEKITDKQWTDIFMLAQVEREGVTKNNLKEWLESIHNKIRNIRKTSCPAFDTYQSVLGQKR